MEDLTDDSDASVQGVASVRTRYADKKGAMKTAHAMGWLITAFSSILVATARADTTYTGTITQRVTQTSDPSYYVGEVFQGYYQYTSPDGNPDFDSIDTMDGPDLVVWSTLPGRDGPTTFLSATHARFAVSNGVIAGFYLVVGDEWRIFVINSGSFYSNYERWMMEPPQDAIYTAGTVVITQPVRLGKVPDGCATLLLVGVSVLLLIPALEHQVRVGRRGPARSRSLPS